MDEGLKLNPDEAVVRRSEKIGYGKKKPFEIPGNRDELVLTNQSLILIKKGLLGGVKDYVRFPLSEVMIANGEAQAHVGKADFMTPTLDVYFQSGQESFRFEWESDARDWADSINEILTGKAPEKKDDMAWVAETLAMADSVAGSINKVRNALGIGQEEEASGICPGCGASISGIRGKTIQCPYCGTYYTF